MSLEGLGVRYRKVAKNLNTYFACLAGCLFVCLLQSTMKNGDKQCNS